MAFIGLIPFVLAMLAFVIMLWLFTAAYFAVIGAITLVPAVITRKHGGSKAIIGAGIFQIIGGIIMGIAFLVIIFTVVFQVDNNPANASTSTEQADMFFNILLGVVGACVVALAGAIMSIVRAVKSRKGGIIPKSLTIVTAVFSILTAAVFTAFSALVMIDVLVLLGYIRV